MRQRRVGGPGILGSRSRATVSAVTRSGAVEDQTMDEGVDIGITDEIDSDMDLIAKSTKGNGILPYIEQEN
jgi:hypothetical protein